MKRLDPLGLRRRHLAKRARAIQKRTGREVRSIATMSAVCSRLDIGLATLERWEKIRVPTYRRAEYARILDEIERVLKADQ